ncbi:transposase [Salibacterium qingdaonense]
MTLLRNSSFWHRHLTRFFQYGQWNDQGVQRKLQRSIYQQVQQMSSSEDPLMVIIDDSICPKTKPSSQALEPTEGASYHLDHKQGKPIYAHQWVTTMKGARGSFLPFAMTPYVKEEYSKLDMARDHMDQIPDGTRDVYLLTDSWYAATSLMDHIQERGWHFIGGLKSNRVLLNDRVPQPVREWAQQKEDQTSCIVTVGDASYYVHRYDGALKGGLQGTVLACQPTNTEPSESSVRYFFSTDSSLTAQKILLFYAERWNIETFFQETKDKLYMGDYRLRSLFAIKRYMLVLQLAYTFIVQHYQQGFSTGYWRANKERRRSLLLYVYQKAQKGVSLQSLEKELMIA